MADVHLSPFSSIHHRLTEFCSASLLLLQPTIQVLSTAVGQYGRRNLRCLCDALVQLGEAAGPRMGDAAIVSTLLPALCQRLSSLGPHDRDLITLMEVLTMVGGWVGG
jgi:hypothetical protein